MLSKIIKEIQLKYPFVKLEVYEIGNKIELQQIEVPPMYRNGGIGHDIIQTLQKYAMSVGKPIVLRPEAETRQKASLFRFYKSLGFVKNSGKNMDYTLSSPTGKTMYWKHESTTFKDFVLNEFGEFNTEEVQFTYKNGKYEYNFDINGLQYSFYFTNKPIKIDSQIIVSYQDAYSIAFGVVKERRGIQGMDYTLTNQGKPFSVYTKVFSAFKKFLDDFEPNGFGFIGTTSAMDVTYNKFYERYLSSIFMRLDDMQYIRRSYYQKLNPQMKQLVDDYSKRLLPAVNAFLTQTKQDKRFERRLS
jgi:GNAT superfamily N-acetyltransferase